MPDYEIAACQISTFMYDEDKVWPIYSSKKKQKQLNLKTTKT